VFVECGTGCWLSGRDGGVLIVILNLVQNDNGVDFSRGGGSDR